MNRQGLILVGLMGFAICLAVTATIGLRDWNLPTPTWGHNWHNAGMP